jgi:hypothetical protein
LFFPCVMCSLLCVVGLCVLLCVCFYLLFSVCVVCVVVSVVYVVCVCVL